MRRFVRSSASLLVICILLIASFLAGRAAVDERPTNVPVATTQSVTARPGSVIDQGPARVLASWPRVSSLLNRFAGTITSSALTSGAARFVHAGDEIYSVDEQPVVVAQGDVPSYRVLHPGDSGRDVRQLQTLFITLGYRTRLATGTWDAEMSDEFGRWAAATDAPRSTDPISLPLGAVLFVPRLPARMAATSALSVGRTISDDATSAEVLADTPQFVVDLIPNTANSRDLPAGLKVSVDVGTTELLFRSTDKQNLQESGSTYADLDPAQETLACDSWCDLLPTDKPSLWPGTVEYTPETSGIVVPVAALLVDAEGQTQIIAADTGKRIRVRVVAQFGSTAVVDGIADGQVVRLPTTGS